MSKTPAEKWNEAIINYRKKCQEILAESKNIRYVGVINNYGRTLTGTIRPTIKPLLKSEQVKNEFFVVSVLMGLRKETEKSVGPLEHVLLKHEKISILLINKNDVTFYVSIDKTDKSIEKLILKIKKMI